MLIGQLDIDQAHEDLKEKCLFKAQATVTQYERYLQAKLDSPIYTRYPAGYKLGTGQKQKPGYCLQPLSETKAAFISETKAKL